MAHEISEVMINGQRIIEAVYANKPAWHMLGTIFDPEGHRGMNSEYCIENGHLGWQVGLRPLFQDLNGSFTGHGMKDFRGLFREDTNECLAVVGKKYTPLQNREAFKLLDDLRMDAVMEYEAAFALKGGREVCLLARLPSIDWVIPGKDGMLRYILLSMSHGYGGIRVLPTAVRVVCANTQRLALSRGRKLTYTIRHSGNMKTKIEEAQRYLSQVDVAFTEYRDKAQHLLKPISASERKEYIKALFPEVAEDASERVKGNREKQIQSVENAFDRPAQLIEGVKGTWWEVFNAVTEVVDHDAPLRKVGDERKYNENRFLRVTNGGGAKFKDKALKVALSMAG